MELTQIQKDTINIIKDSCSCFSDSGFEVYGTSLNHLGLPSLYVKSHSSALSIKRNIKKLCNEIGLIDKDVEVATVHKNNVKLINNSINLEKWLTWLMPIALKTTEEETPHVDHELFALLPSETVEKYKSDWEQQGIPLHFGMTYLLVLKHQKYDKSDLFEEATKCTLQNYDFLITAEKFYNRK